MENDNRTTIYRVNQQCYVTRNIKHNDIMEKTLAKNRNIYSGMVEPFASRLIHVRKESIKESLGRFPNVPHRLEEVATIRGVEFINDSKATNVNATWYALESMHKPVIWIAGGQDNGNDYSALASLAAKKVKTLICLGADNTRLSEYFRSRIASIFDVKDVIEAVNVAYLAGSPGDVVMLSPACPSFDLFKDYADKGNRFKKAVYAL